MKKLFLLILLLSGTILQAQISRDTIYKATYWGKNLNEAINNPIIQSVEIVISDSIVKITFGTKSTIYKLKTRDRVRESNSHIIYYLNDNSNNMLSIYKNEWHDNSVDYNIKYTDWVIPEAKLIE